MVIYYKSIFLYLLLPLSFVLPVNSVCLGQSVKLTELHEDFDKAYGLNTHLYNGKKYYRENRDAIGHPFWIQEEAFSGSLSVSGRVYSDLQIKYELHKQIFILEYKEYSGAQQAIILNNQSIDSVMINERVFIKNPFGEIDNEFIQQVYPGKFSAYISHSKEFLFQNVGVQSGYKYSKEIKKPFIVINDNILAFGSRRSFLQIFPDQKRKEIKQYISSQRIRMKKLQDDQFRELIIVCNNIVE